MSVFVKEQLDTERPPSLMVRRIIQATEKLAELPEGILRGMNRSREYVRPRHIAMLACREIAKASFPQIGKAFCGRHHTSVMHACRVAKTRKDWASDLDLIRKALEAAR